MLLDLSPPGHGFDTHRTWESLALGLAVIVLSGPIDALYVDLPVVRVESFAEITPERLRRWAASELCRVARRTISTEL